MFSVYFFTHPFTNRILIKGYIPNCEFVERKVGNPPRKISCLPGWCIKKVHLIDMELLCYIASCYFHSILENTNFAIVFGNSIVMPLGMFCNICVWSEGYIIGPMHAIPDF